MAVTRQSWAKSLLSALNVPTTNANLRIVVGWEVAEGGAGPQFGVAKNTANYNPLNTTLGMPGSTTIAGNPSRIQSYVSWEQGLEATYQTLTGSDPAYGYGRIISMLQSGSATPSTAASTISGTSWNPGSPSWLSTTRVTSSGFWMRTRAQSSRQVATGPTTCFAKPQRASSRNGVADRCPSPPRTFSPAQD